MTFEHVKTRYRAAIEPLKNPPKDIETWVTAWEQAIRQAHEKKLGMVTDPEDWFDDFLDALRPVKPRWVESYELLNREKVIAKSVTYRDVANALRTASRREA